MRAKKAKAIRRAAREIAIESGLPMSKELYSETKGRRQHTAVLRECAPAVANQIKRMVKNSPNVPVEAIDQAGFDATFLDQKGGEE